MVGCPTHNGLQNDALINEGAVRIVANGVTEQVTVACGIREIVLAFIFMHPRGLEEAVWVASLQGLSVLVEDNNRTWSLGELKHIVGHAGHITVKCRNIGRSPEFGLLVGSVTYINVSSGSRHGVGLLDGSYTQGNMPLQLTAPQTSVVAEDTAVIVLENARVDAVGTTDGIFLWNEWAFWLVGNGYTQVEFSIIILGREDEIVFAILFYYVAVPHLLLHPRHLVLVEDNAMVGNRTVLDIFEREDVVVTHLEVAAIIVEDIVALAVVAGVDVQLIVKHMSRRVGHIVTGE
jgi:hypothetical protein